MKVLQVIPYMETKYGGPVFVTTMINHFLNVNNIKNKILTVDSDQARENDQVVTYKRSSKFWFFSVDLLFNAHKEVKNCSHILVHGVYTFFTFWLFILALIYKKNIFLRPAGMLDMHSIFSGSRLKSFVRLLFLLSFGVFYSLKSKKIIFNSEKERSNSLFGILKKSIVLFNGVDPNIANTVCIKKHFSKPIKLFFMGRIHPIKGIELLIDAVNNIDEDIGKNIELIVAGDGERLYVNRMKSKSGSNIKYIGHIEGDLKYQYLNECDIYLQPSHTEGLSNSMLEAMFCKVAMITTTNVGLASELLLNKAAEVVAYKRKDLTNAIVKVIQSEKIMAQYKCKSYKFANDFFSFEQNIHNYIDIFNQK
jgi:glycosyltransferase involved in cell wall biosynthesis